MDRSVAAGQQVPNVDVLRGEVPSSPEGSTVLRQEIIEDELKLFMDARSIRDVYQAWLVGKENVDLLAENLDPWLRGDVQVTVSPVEQTLRCIATW